MTQLPSRDPPASEITDETLRILVRAFYARVRRDPELGPVFEAAVEDWDEHLERLTAFWSSVMLTSGRYKGDPLTAHRRQPIRPDMFERWLGLWAETTAEMFTPESAAVLQARAERIGRSLHLALFFDPSSASG